MLTFINGPNLYNLSITKHGNALKSLNCYCYGHGRESSSDRVYGFSSKPSTIFVICSESVRLTSHHDKLPPLFMCLNASCGPVAAQYPRN